MAHPIAHIELSAKDRDAMAKFYNTIFGWKIDHNQKLDYMQLLPGERPSLALDPVSENVPAGNVTVYLGTDDIDASLESIEKGGGTMVVPKQEIPTVGWFAVFIDPAGNKLAFFQSLQ
jgi:predicted enzyme related to lactoylglutathione lyase